MTDSTAIRPVVHAVVINAIDSQRLVDFWSALLDVEVAQSIPPFFTWLKPQHDGGISVAIQLVENPTEGRNRLHLDMSVDDLEEATRRVQELGGSMLEEHEIQGFTWRVMADPEDNEFCIAVG
jgi:predicted enzyme related to lactoylglutathione lyase